METEENPFGVSSEVIAIATEIVGQESGNILDEVEEMWDSLNLTWAIRLISMGAEKLGRPLTDDEKDLFLMFVNVGAARYFTNIIAASVARLAPNEARAELHKFIEEGIALVLREECDCGQNHKHG